MASSSSNVRVTEGTARELIAALGAVLERIPQDGQPQGAQIQPGVPQSQHQARSRVPMPLRQQARSASRVPTTH